MCLEEGDERRRVSKCESMYVERVRKCGGKYKNSLVYDEIHRILIETVPLRGLPGMQVGEHGNHSFPPQGLSIHHRVVQEVQPRPVASTPARWFQTSNHPRMT